MSKLKNLTTTIAAKIPRRNTATIQPTCVAGPVEDCASRAIHGQLYQILDLLSISQRLRTLLEEIGRLFLSLGERLSLLVQQETVSQAVAGGTRRLTQDTKNAIEALRRCESCCEKDISELEAVLARLTAATVAQDKVKHYSEKISQLETAVGGGPFSASKLDRNRQKLQDAEDKLVQSRQEAPTSIPDLCKQSTGKALAVLLQILLASAELFVQGNKSCVEELSPALRQLQTLVPIERPAFKKESAPPPPPPPPPPPAPAPPVRLFQSVINSVTRAREKEVRVQVDTETIREAPPLRPKFPGDSDDEEEERGTGTVGGGAGAAPPGAPPAAPPPRRLLPFEEPPDDSGGISSDKPPHQEKQQSQTLGPATPESLPVASISAGVAGSLQKPQKAAEWPRLSSNGEKSKILAAASPEERPAGHVAQPCGEELFALRGEDGHFWTSIFAGSTRWQKDV